MSSQAIKHDPKTWRELKYQDTAVKLAQKWLAENKFPNMVFVSGSPGVGKTSFTKLLVNSIRCTNRQAGEVNGCGKCRICKQDPRDSGAMDNIVWIQSGKEETLGAQLNEALDEINSPTYGILPDHRDYKVIVIDEAQRLNRQQLQDLLFFPDLGSRMNRNRVLVVFVTMAEEKIDPVIRDALRSRSTYLKFRTPTPADVAEGLMSIYPLANRQSVELIATRSNGNFRWGHNTIGDCLDLDPQLSEVTVSAQLQLLSSNDRKELWSILESCDSNTGAGFKRYRAFWSALTDVDHAALAEQLIRDVEESINSMPSEGQMKALIMLSEYVSGITRLRLHQVLYPLVGMKLVDMSLFANKLSEVEMVLGTGA